VRQRTGPVTGGLISLGIAVIRAKASPRWVGALFIASAPLSFVQVLPGPLALLGDYLAFAGLIAIGCKVAAATVGYAIGPAAGALLVVSAGPRC
jgi:hypothetical protein